MNLFENKVNIAIPIIHTLGSGAENLYPQAVIVSKSNIVLETLNLEHKISGIYKPTSVYLMPNQDYVTITTTIYTDSSHETESEIYDRETTIIRKHTEVDVSAFSVSQIADETKEEVWQAELLDYEEESAGIYLAEVSDEMIVISTFLNQCKSKLNFLTSLIMGR